MKKPKIRCPSCGSSQAYIRRKTGAIACPECGDVTPIKKDLSLSPKLILSPTISASDPRMP